VLERVREGVLAKNRGGNRLEGDSNGVGGGLYSGEGRNERRRKLGAREIPSANCNSRGASSRKVLFGEGRLSALGRLPTGRRLFKLEKKRRDEIEKVSYGFS